MIGSYTVYQRSSELDSTVLLVGNDAELQSGVFSALSPHYEVEEVSDIEEARRAVDEKGFICALVDLSAVKEEAQRTLRNIQKISKQLPVIVLCSASDISTGVEAIRAGAADFIIKEVEVRNLAARVEKTVGKSVKTTRDEPGDSDNNERAWAPGQMIVGRSKRMLDAMKLARRAASYPVTVLLLGESGTGKELFARWIHQMSESANGPFVGVNLAAIPSDLIESTLFGHVKGSFTGAVGHRVGKFALAQGGTLLLDEITELKLELQPKLLRVLQEGEFEPVGSEKIIRSEARIVAATNRDIYEQVKNGNFRSDLLYRLNVITVTLPSLRERKEDIPDLVQLFLAKYGALYGKPNLKVSAVAMEALVDHNWPGNIRELENLIQRAVIVTEAATISVEDLFENELYARSAQSERTADGEGTLEDLERQYVEEVLRRTGGHQGEAARILGIDRKTLYNKIIKYGLGRSLQRKAG